MRIEKKDREVILPVGESEKSYISSLEFQSMVDAFVSNPEDFDAAAKALYLMISRIVSIKCRTYLNSSDIEDLVQEVNCRVFTRLSQIIHEPVQFFSRNGKEATRDDLGKCFHNYVIRIAMNFLWDKHRKKIDTLSIDEFGDDDFFEKIISDEKRLAEVIEEEESAIVIYQLCLAALFKLRVKPYIVLGFCFNVLIYGAESDHAKRGCSSYTAEAIADKMLGVLRDEFCRYHKDYLHPIPPKIIAPFDERLQIEYENKMYKMHIPRTFYGRNPEKSIADWTYTTRQSLLKSLIKEPEIIEYIGE